MKRSQGFAALSSTSRRELLKNSLVASISAGLGMSWARQALGDTVNGKTVVVIFQRGGSDNLNACVPYGDPKYQVLRPAPDTGNPNNIGIPAPNGSDPTSAVDLNGFFGLHPRLCVTSNAATTGGNVACNGGFKSLWDDGRLAVCPAVSFVEKTLSHFRNQDILEAMPPDNDNLTADGYLNRYLQSYAGMDALYGACINTSLAKSIRGAYAVPALPRIVGYNFYNVTSSLFDKTTLAGQSVTSIVEENAATLQASQPPKAEQYGELVRLFGQKLQSDIDLFAQLTDPAGECAAFLDGSGNPVAQNGAKYAGTLDTTGKVNPAALTSLSVKLRDAAHIIRCAKTTSLAVHNQLKPRVIAIDHGGGYDTHTFQGGGSATGTQSKLFFDLSQSIRGFYDDLGSFGDNVVTIVQTEFGRTVQMNASNGTDHGYAACYFVVGAGTLFHPGIYYHNANTNPGQNYNLTPNNSLDSTGRYLMETMQYKDLFENVFRKHLAASANIASIIPRAAGTAAYVNPKIFN